MKNLSIVIVGASGDLAPLAHMSLALLGAGATRVNGVEMPEERKAAGKPEMGTVHLDAYYQGDRINIRVTDDGNGFAVALALHFVRPG